LSKTEKPEFDDWRWVNFWYPVDQVIEFKRDVYRKALQQLETPFSSYIGSPIINC
jgi:putative (di)nucleoside polyphosphate hydrolase